MLGYNVIVVVIIVVMITRNTDDLCDTNLTLLVMHHE